MKDISISAASVEEILGFLKEEFVATDNVIEDVVPRNVICADSKASFLLEANCTSGSFPNYMRAGTYKDHGWVYPLPEMIRIDDKNNRGCYFKFWEFEIRTDAHNTPDFYGQKGCWRLRVEPSLKVHAEGYYGVSEIQINGLGQSYTTDAVRFFESQNLSKFKRCEPITPYNTYEKTCRFFDNDTRTFSELKLKSGVMRNDIFIDGEAVETDELKSTRAVNPKCAEETIVECILRNKAEKNSCDMKIEPVYGKLYSGWLRMVYSFKNQYGDIIMKVVKYYNNANQSKVMVPMTMWMRSHSTETQLYRIPAPGKQPLYNLHLIKNLEQPTVIMTDSIELADINQAKSKLPGVVFTSFICDPEEYGQVDFSPLKDASSVFYLISNHSGLLLETQYVRANKIAEHLEEEYDIQVKFIQMKVDYKTNNSFRFSHVQDIANEYRKNPPLVNKASIELMESREDFEVNYEKAMIALNSRKKEWWEKTSESITEEAIDAVAPSHKENNYLFYPILVKGEVTMIYAGKGIGKSALAYSIAAAAVSSSTRGKAVFNEKWWTASKCNYGLHKVLYLDFENMGSTITQRKEEFVMPYLPSRKEDAEKSMRNLIMKDMTSCEPADYTLPANHQKIFDMLDEAKETGMKGQDVDLLVIDTYTKFVQSETPVTPAHLAELLNKLREKKIAILILHHSNEEGKARGLKAKIDNLFFNISLSREEETACTLETPLKVTYHADRSALSNELIKPFMIKYEDQEWKVFEPERTADEELELIANDLKKKKYDSHSIAGILGMSKSSLYDKLSKKK